MKDAGLANPSLTGIAQTVTDMVSVHSPVSAPAQTTTPAPIPSFRSTPEVKVKPQG